MKSTLVHETPAQRIARINAETLALRNQIASGKLPVQTANAVKVTQETRKLIVSMLEHDGVVAEFNKLTGKPKAYGKYDFPCFMASKIFYACKALGKSIDADGMSEQTAIQLVKAYGL